MKSNPISLVSTLLILSLSAFCQQPDDAIYFRSGAIHPAGDITTDRLSELDRQMVRKGRPGLYIIRFGRIPSIAERKRLEQSGIQLLDYIPNNAYSAIVRGSLASAGLAKANVTSVLEMTPQMKLEPALAAGDFPAHAVKVPGTVDVWVSFPRSLTFGEVTADLKAKNFDLVDPGWKDYRVIGIRIAASRLNELAAMDCIDYVQAAPAADQVLNNKTTTNARANVLRAPAGRNLRGEGIVIGIGDDADPTRHIDFYSRLINRSSAVGNVHGIHVTGIAAGGGIVDEKYMGFAPKARIVAQSMSNILASAPVYVQDYGMVITNNSYGNITNDCATFGVYDLYSRILDLQELQMPHLQHVFAAGNSGTYSCTPYTPGFSNVLGGYQTAKNVITVGNTDEWSVIRAGSSKGPVRDGRIKPEITAQGYTVVSSYPVDGYGVISGTSMAAPGVSGGLALLYQRYRQLNSGADPKNGLMKAILCNGATDKGNTGPDYSYGFGWMNLVRSVTILEKGNYFNSTVNASGTATHSISIPSGSQIAQLKVMLYWNDSAAAPLAAHTLVNDLDLEVTDPSSTVRYPQLLDTIPSNVTNTATTGPDHFNNIEQVVIDSPAPGTYTLSVKGTTIPFAGQHEYFLVFDTIPVSTTLTNPVGDERLAAGDQIYIDWDSYGFSSNDFALQYSTDNGSTWVNINSNVAAGLRQYSWTLPGVTTDQARVRLIHNGTGIESTSGPFTILGIPQDSLAPVQCEGYITLNWSPVAGATDYEVMMLRGDELVPMATTGSTTYTFSGLSKDSIYRVTVRARLNGHPGRRAIAVSRQPDSGTCAGSISDNDLKIDAVLAPLSGRMATSSSLTASTAIQVRIKNLDDATNGSFNIKYSVNGGAFVTETNTSTVAALGTYIHSFASTYNFSAPGAYLLTVVVQNTAAADPVPANDTLAVLIRQLPNLPITLVTGSDLLDDIETAADSTYYQGQIGLDGADRYDFKSTSVYGRLRTFVNSGIAYSGSKALTLDAERVNGGTADSLIATFNLQPHAGTLDDIRLDFFYKQHGQGPDAPNKIWIRGDDQKPWILAYDLYANQEDLAIYKKTSSIELSDLLAANGQDFSGSFGVKFGEFGYYQTADDYSAGGYTFDDIHLYKVDNDIQMLALDSPVVSSCGLNASTPIRVIVRNAADTSVTSVPVKYSIDGGAVTTENISSLSGNTNLTYSFAAGADLSAPGVHTVRVWVDYPGDSFRDNDTLTVSIVNFPVVSSFPYLEDFEAGDGGWHSEGKNDTWEYGTPASAKINRAASGSKAWKTSLAGYYRDRQLSYLYSPCFDLTGMTNPTLSLSIALDLEDCGSVLCDGAYVEYSSDGVSWSRLGAAGQGTNWYNKNYSLNNLWSVQNYTRWHVATIPLPAGYSRLRLRFVMNADPFTAREGVGIDDIHIYDNVHGIYTGSPDTSNAISQAAVSGSGWVDFSDGGRLIASINPRGQNLGNTIARAYISRAAVRHSNGQYYHDRNITIKPASRNLPDSATVRFYFLDSETELLIAAAGCGTCSKPASAYELGVSKYSDADTSIENNLVTDNSNPANWLFIRPANVRKVPFDKGYYAEFNVREFSEFWLNNGGIGNNNTLPTELSGFTARKQGINEVIVQWETASEVNVSHFEIEVAKGNAPYQQGQFVKLGEQPATGSGGGGDRYRFLDEENNKSGVRYYRLKIVDMDGGIAYSAVRPVVFNEEVKWQVYPNPSTGIFNFVYQVNAGESLQARLYDANGKLLHQTRLAGSGFIDKYSIDLTARRFPAGLYLLDIRGSSHSNVFRLVKQQ